MAQLIDGKKVSAEVRAELAEEVKLFVAAGNRAPQLTAILVGEDPASRTYVNNKMKAAKEIGIDSVTKNLPADVTEEALLEVIEQLNKDDSVDGILVQLPVPAHINERRICNAVSVEKDVDCFHEVNVGRLCLDMPSVVPCTPMGVLTLLKYYKIDTFGKNVVVIGRSKNVGMPIAMLMHTDGNHTTFGMDGTVTICHRYTPAEELRRFCLSADIIVSATGVVGLVKADMVKEGVVIVDVGITRITCPKTGKPKLVGDVEFEEVSQKASYITPVPGGVGPMTVAMLMKNTIVVAKNQSRKRSGVQNGH